jgi:hypothetical protein
MPGVGGAPSAPAEAAAVAEDRAKSVPAADLDRMARVLERRLLALALYARLSAEERAALPALDAGLACLVVGDSVEVLVRATAPEALDRVAASGMRVQRLDGGPGADALAIVVIPVSRLQEIALMQGVRAIAPTEPSHGR